jgi:hypothetical protein
VVLTVKGKAAAIVQDAEAYQGLLDVAAGVDAEEGIRQGLDDVAHGRTRLAKERRSAIRNSTPEAWHGQIAQACGVRLTRYLIDTNVVSELRKPKPDRAAVSWLQGLELGQGFFSAVTL